METVTISKKEYEALKKKASAANVDEEVVQKFKRALEDIKHGRITEWKPQKT